MAEKIGWESHPKASVIYITWICHLKLRIFITTIELIKSHIIWRLYFTPSIPMTIGNYCISRLLNWKLWEGGNIVGLWLLCMSIVVITISFIWRREIISKVSISVILVRGNRSFHQKLESWIILKTRSLNMEIWPRIHAWVVSPCRKTPFTNSQNSRIYKFYVIYSIQSSNRRCIIRDS